MRTVKCNITLIPDFRLRKKLLDTSTCKIGAREVNINPTMSMNLLVIHNNGKYMADKLAMIYSLMLSDNTLENSSTTISRKYDVKYDNGYLSLVFGNGSKMKVRMPKNIVNNMKYSHVGIDANIYAGLAYAANGILNIPKYEYPISVMNSKTDISVINMNNTSVLYIHTSKLTFPKKLKILNSKVIELVDELRDIGDSINTSKGQYTIVTRVLSIINYCSYFTEVNTKLISSLISAVSTHTFSSEELDSMIAYMVKYKEIVAIKDKFVNTPKKKI